jgi:hypothetical protein
MPVRTERGIRTGGAAPVAESVTYATGVPWPLRTVPSMAEWYIMDIVAIFWERKHHVRITVMQEHRQRI